MHLVIPLNFLGVFQMLNCFLNPARVGIYGMCFEQEEVQCVCQQHNDERFQ